MSCREILMRELKSRQLRRPSYSLRAFARDLQVPAPKLSQILNGKCGISGIRAQHIAERIALDHEQSRSFVLMAEVAFARKASARERAKTELGKLRDTVLASVTTDEKSQAIREWSTKAINDLKSISVRFGLSEASVDEALEMLSRSNRSP